MADATLSSGVAAIRIAPVAPTDTISETVPAHAPTNLTNPSRITASPEAPEPGLFGDELILPGIAASLPPTYTIRALRKSDYAIGFLDCLRVLTTVGDITEEEWDGRYDWMSTQGKGGYYLLVIEDGGRIVGTGALIVERKL
jgi:hypothetical protein